MAGLRQAVSDERAIRAVVPIDSHGRLFTYDREKLSFDEVAFLEYLDSHDRLQDAEIEKEAPSINSSAPTVITKEWKEARKAIITNAYSWQEYSDEFDFGRFKTKCCVEESCDNPLGQSMLADLCGNSSHDFVAVDEAIRLGADINDSSWHFCTPLMLACLSYNDKPCSISVGGQNFDQDVNFKVLRLRTIRRLLEVGSDPDLQSEINGYTVLHLVCLTMGIAAYSVMKLLLEFGADRSIKDVWGKTPEMYLKKPEHRRRFNAIRPVHSNNNYLCWCLSGLLLEECHSDDGKLLEEHDFCWCGNGKRYAKCCGKKGIKVFRAHDSLFTDHKYSQNVAIRIGDNFADLDHSDEGPCNCNASRELICKMVYNVCKFLPDQLLSEVIEERKMTLDDDAMKVSFMDQSPENVKLITCEILCLLVEKYGAGIMDPAYIFACTSCMSESRSTYETFIIHFWKFKITRTDGDHFMNEWNDAVEYYIETHDDSRTPEEISCCAKISWDGSPLYRICDATDCTNKEQSQSNAEKFKRCGKCKCMAYCSVECQRSHWKKHHKFNCGKDEPKDRNTRILHDILLQVWPEIDDVWPDDDVSLIISSFKESCECERCNGIREFKNSRSIARIEDAWRLDLNKASVQAS